MKNFIAKVNLLGVLGAAIALTACGNSNIFSSVELSTNQQNNEEYVSLETDIKSKDITFAGQTLLITHKGVSLGTVKLSTDVASGLSAVVIDFDLTAALNLPDGVLSDTLPNGTVWPITGVDLTKMYSFDVGNDGSKAYLYVNTVTKQTLLGVAIDVTGLTNKTAKNLFTSFSQSGLTGTTGIYLGPATNTSGLGILVDIGAQSGAKSALRTKPNTVDAAGMTEIYESLQDVRAHHSPIVVH